MLRLFCDDVDGGGDGAGRHAGVFIAGLEAEMGLDEMIAGGGDETGFDGEVAGVDVQFGGGIGGEDVFDALGIVRGGEADAGVGGHGKHGGNEELVAGGVGVDVQAGGDAEVEGDGLGLAGGEGDLLGEEVLDLLGFVDGLVGVAEERGLRGQRLGTATRGTAMAGDAKFAYALSPCTALMQASLRRLKPGKSVA